MILCIFVHKAVKKGFIGNLLDFRCIKSFAAHKGNFFARVCSICNRIFGCARIIRSKLNGIGYLIRSAADINRYAAIRNSKPGNNITSLFYCSKRCIDSTGIFIASVCCNIVSRFGYRRFPCRNFYSGRYNSCTRNAEFIRRNNLNAYIFICLS